MKAVLQRVSRAEVRVAGRAVAAIRRGVLLLVAVERTDEEADLRWCADKSTGARIFPDEEGKMNRSLAEVGGEVLAVSQFTLVGSLRRGRRPSFDDAAPPEAAEPMYRRFLELLAANGLPVQSGVFQAEMEVDLVNDGPVTLLLDSSERLRPRRA